MFGVIQSLIALLDQESMFSDTQKEMARKHAEYEKRKLIQWGLLCHLPKSQEEKTKESTESNQVRSTHLHK